MLSLGTLTYDFRMTDFNMPFATGRLKNVSLTEIEQAIAGALCKLVGENDTERLSVHISSLEFSDYMGSKVILTLRSTMDERNKENSYGKAPELD